MSKKIKVGIKKDLSKLSSGLEFPAATLGAGAHIELFSNKSAVIDGCVGVIEYTSELIKLNIGKGAIMFTGTDLKILYFNDKQLSLTGFIANVEFCV